MHRSLRPIVEPLVDIAMASAVAAVVVVALAAVVVARIAVGYIAALEVVGAFAARMAGCY